MGTHRLMKDHRQQIADRLIVAIERKGLPSHGRATVIAKRFDVTPKAVGKWLNGESVPEIGTLIDLADWLGVDVAWILTGEPPKGINLNNNQDLDLGHIVAIEYAPLISWTQAGNWTDMENIKATMECEKLPLVPGAGKRSFYLEVRGLSNAPFFEDGEKICIDPDWAIEDISTGEMVVVAQNGEATFKALIVESNGYYLKPLNSSWHEQITPLDSNYVLVGKYVGSFKLAKRYNLNQ